MPNSNENYMVIEGEYIFMDDIAELINSGYSRDCGFELICRLLASEDFIKILCRKEEIPDGCSLDIIKENIELLKMYLKFEN